MVVPATRFAESRMSRSTIFSPSVLASRPRWKSFCAGDGCACLAWNSRRRPRSLATKLSSRSPRTRSGVRSSSRRSMRTAMTSG